MEISIWLAKVVAQWAILAVLIIVALLRGNAPERICAGIFTTMFALDQLYHILIPHGVSMGGLNVGHFVIDLAAMAAFGVVALQANRIYPLCIAGLQIDAVTSHFLLFLAPSINAQTYGILVAAPSYLQMLAFMVGLVWYLWRQSRSGPYPSWRTS